MIEQTTGWMRTDSRWTRGFPKVFQIKLQTVFCLCIQPSWVIILENYFSLQLQLCVFSVVSTPAVQICRRFCPLFSNWLKLGQLRWRASVNVHLLIVATDSPVVLKSDLSLCISNTWRSKPDSCRSGYEFSFLALLKIGSFFLSLQSLWVTNRFFLKSCRFYDAVCSLMFSNTPLRPSKNSWIYHKPVGFPAFYLGVSE